MVRLLGGEKYIEIVNAADSFSPTLSMLTFSDFRETERSLRLDERNLCNYLHTCTIDMLIYLT